MIYVLVSIKYHIGNDLDQGHYICDVLDYNTGTWWEFDDEIVTKYPGYPMNVYNEVSSDKKTKKGKRHDMDVSESIVSMIYIRKDILTVRTYSFINGISKTTNMEHILERKADFEDFKNEAQLIEKHVTLFSQVFRYGSSTWKA